MRLSNDIVDALDTAVVVYLHNLLDQTINITTIAKRTTINKSDFEAVLKLKK